MDWVILGIIRGWLGGGCFRIGLGFVGSLGGVGGGGSLIMRVDVCRWNGEKRGIDR
jgi:hypothetical protein